MYIVVDHLGGTAAETVQDPLDRYEGVEEQPGFLSLELLQPLAEEEGRGAEYVVLTRWRFADDHALWAAARRTGTRSPSAPSTRPPGHYRLCARRSARFLGE